MGENSANAAPGRFRAFISYSHADAKFAHWLHRNLESWRLPDKSRLAPVFIDRAELSAGSDLSAQVRDALAESAALVVVCSPNAVASRWVGQEIALFRELYPGRPVLAALIEGEPDQAFPDALVKHGDTALEPLAADFRKGHDGQRLGLLKLAAGLTALPLDRLVQRDAQQRQRRVMAITAAAVLLVLILSAALVIALRARAEAERQRAEAEGLVEFMLTDLRDKLKGVGRLDVMDAVNERAMEHYANNDLAGQPADILLRRSRLLLAMAEDNLSQAGGQDNAKAEIEEAWRITTDLLRRSPNDQNRIFDHAQSEFWMGNFAYRNRATNPNLLLAKAESHWLAYLRLAERLVALDSQSLRWRKELAYSHGNICTLMLESPSNQSRLRDSCRMSREIMQSLAAAAPGDVDLQLDLANRLAWEADSLERLGQSGEAVRVRSDQVELVKGLAEQSRSDARISEAVLLANYGLAKAYLKTGQIDQARRTATVAGRTAEMLRRLDPENRSWREWQSKLERDFNID